MIFTHYSHSFFFFLTHKTFSTASRVLVFPDGLCARVMILPETFVGGKPRPLLPQGICQARPSRISHMANVSKI